MRDDHLLVVLDVDNTLYDWVAIWAGAFSSLAQTLATKTQRSVDEWLIAARAVHARRGSMECPSLLCDLASSQWWPTAVDPGTVMPLAAAAYREHWDRHLTTYAGVREALTDVAALGHAVVAYTEGDVTIAATRLTRLGLAGTIRRVFGRPPLPPASEPSWCPINVIRNSPIAVDFIPREDTKPNPTGLRTIIALCGASPHHAVYVGDNLWKDVVMAQTLGAAGMWARYGTTRDPQHVELLERVAHWAPQAVASERATSLNTVTPDAVLDDPRDLALAISQRAVAMLS